MAEIEKGTGKGEALTPRTKREALLMRKAFCLSIGGMHIPDREKIAEKYYPIPTRSETRPREVKVTDLVYRVRADGNLECRDTTHPGGTFSISGYTPHVIRVLADLLANPTETVEVEVDEE